MRNLYLFIALVFTSGLMFGQTGGCGNRINTVTFYPVPGTTDLTMSINSDCCDVHNLDSSNYVNAAPNHTVTLCYRDSGLLMQTNITSQITLPNANAAGNQTFAVNSFYYFGGAGGVCSASNPSFNAPVTLSFTGPLTQPRIFTLANNEFETLKFKLYPNPNNGVFSIDLPASVDKVQLAIFDVSGKQVYTDVSYASGQSIALKNLSGGIYFAKVVSGQSAEVVKFVIR